MAKPIFGVHVANLKTNPFVMVVTRAHATSHLNLRILKKLKLGACAVAS